ncbi:MAG: hypothetical protein ACO1SX_10180 [Actinomycetota bacterium]
MIEVDVLTILGTGETVLPQVSDALSDQGCVRLRRYETPGPRIGGEGRMDAIVRARNAARTCGAASLAFFLDRDVALPPRAIERLAFALKLNPAYAALGVDYQGGGSSPARHVAMGAVLIQRSVLARMEFRWAPNRCECSCFCDDLRAAGYGIDYLPGLRASHLKEPATAPSPGWLRLARASRLR